MLFCPNFSNKKVKKEFDELKSLFGEDGAYFLWNKNNGYGMDRYPNGQPSALFYSVIQNTGSRTMAIKAVAQVLSNDSDEFMFHRKTTSEAKYNYGRQVNETREDREQQLKQYYMAAYDFSSLLENYRNDVLQIKNSLERTFYDDYNADTEEDKKAEAERHKKLLQNYNNPYIKSVGIRRNNNGSLTVYVQTYTPKELLDRKIDDYIKHISDDQMMSELQRFEQDELSMEMYHINPKRIPELKQQIANKNSLLSQSEIDSAIQFLVELENTQENNAYVECCLKWLKNGTIRLPQDNEKIRQAFDLARTHHIDIQKCKSPIDVYLHAQKNSEIVRKDKKVDISSIREFTFAEVKKVNGKDVYIYNVEDSVEGATAVAQLLADTGLYDQDKQKSIPFSPWCLATHNIDENGRATLTESARDTYWPRYNQGKRQIAICEGKPIAFNSSSYKEDQWWDFYDRSHDTIEDVDTNAPNVVYGDKISQGGSYECIGFGNFWYGYRNKKLESVSDNYVYGYRNKTVGFYISDRRAEFSVPVDGAKVTIDTSTFEFVSDTVGFTSDGFTTDPSEAKFFNEIRIRRREGQLTIENAAKITVPDEIKKKINLLLDVVYSKIGKMDVSVADVNDKRIINLSNEIYKFFADSVKAIYDEIGRATPFPADGISQPTTPPIQEPTTEAGQQAVVEMIAQNAQRQFDEPIVAERRQTVVNGIENQYAQEDERIFSGRRQTVINGISGTYEDYYIPGERSDNTNIDWIIEDVRRAVQEKTTRKNLYNLYKKYLEKPVNDQLSKKLISILKKYHFEVLEAPLNEAFGDDVLGAYDILQKIIYLTNHKDRNAITDAEEFSHAFFKMMGSVYRKNLKKYPHAALYHKLRDLVEQTQIYLDTLEEYKDDPQYKYKNGGVDLPKIKEEALGKALAAALNNRYETDHSFYKRILRWFNNVIDWFKSLFGNKATTLEKELDKIAGDILHDNYMKYLEVLNHSNWNQVTWKETIQKDIDEEGGFGIKFMQFASKVGGYVAGSVSVRAQGKLYRSEVESLHDFDIAFPLSLHKLHTHADFENHHWESQELLDLIYQSEGSGDIIQAFLQQYPNMRPVSAFAVNNNVTVNYMICDDVELYERFKNMSGNFNQRLSQFTEDERKQIHLVDLFFNDDDIASKKAITVDNVNLSNFRNSFREKLSFSRPKDLIDYQLWEPFEREYKVDSNSAFFYNLSQSSAQENEESEQEYTEQQVFDDVQQLDSELEEYIAGQEIHEPDYNIRKTTQANGKIRLSLPSHTEERPRQIVLEPQGDNKFYVHMRIWNGEKIPGDISDSEKRQLFDALYDELPDGAEILFPKSGPGYYGTRGTVAGLMRLSRDPRFTPGTPGVLQYEDKNGQIKTYEGTSFIKVPSATKTVQQATEEWGQKKQREIMGETQLHLAQAFGLTQQEDGTWATNDNSAVGKLRVEFVNSMSTPGSIDFNEASTNAHTVIAIGLNEADASTFNHELAHYYIRTFWNSKAVQDALDMVYVKEMGDYKNDPAARIAVEEALADYMTQRTIDSSFLTNIESQSYFQRFWEAFNKMLYKVFNIKTNAARNAILSQITKSFYVNEKLDDNNRKIKYAMHRGTMYQTEAQRRRVRTNRSIIYQQVSRSDFENTVGKIVKAIQSKAKSYQTQSIGKVNSVYGDEQQIAFNQESVRIVKEFSRTLGELQAAKDDAAILNEKFKLIMSFLERADEEANRVLRMFKNARANNYKKVMYNVDSKGNRQYEDTSNAPIVPATATPATQQREFSWDDLQYAKNDIVGFFKEVIDNVKDIVVNAQNFGLSAAQAQQLLDFIQNSGVSDNVEQIERLYNESRRKKCLEWIDETVDSRDELDDDFKNRLKINMYKWLDEQMDFGDVSVFEKYAGMASMSKSPILRAFQDEISKMQQEKDEAVHKKALELRDKLAQARKEAGLKYRILPFNVQKLLMQLDKHGLPTGNLISKYNQGQYKKDLAEYRDQVLFSKGGIEDKLKALKDASGKPLFEKKWKLKLDEYDNLVLPDDPLCYDIEKEYMKLIEDFKGDREIRRFTKQYYIDRINTLSTTTLRRLNELEERIRRITEAVTINGKLRIDLLTEDQQDQLKMLYDQRSQMGSLTNIDGSYKVPGTEEFKVAEEIKAWRLKTRGKIRYTVDWVAYRDAENNTKDRYAFQKRFTKIVINPQIWDELQKFKTHYPESDPRVRRLASLKYDRAKLIAPYQGFEIGQFDWDSLFDESTGKLKNEKFFENLRKLDEEISNLQQDLWEDYKPAKGQGKKQPQVLEELMIPAHLIPGVSKWRPALNSPADQSQYDFMIERIREAVNNDPSMNATQKAQEILRLESLLQYHDAREDIDMSLSMFSVLLPINSVVTEINKKKFQSFVQMPTSVFQKVDTRYGSAYVDARYDDTKSGIQLTDRYLDKRYQKYFSEDSKLKELLEAAQDCMKEGFKMIPFLQEYDGRMAQIGARTGQILGRKWYDPRRMWKNFCEFLRREWEIVETDTQFLPNEEYETRPDGSKIQNIPLRFIRRLDNPEYISSDVIGSIIKFYDMAKNYQIKARNASKLTSILNELSKQDNLTAAKAQGRWNTSQSEIAEGILDRQVFETKNVDSNSRQNFIENEWSHLDWFRRYFVSNPATWLKRLSKSRAAFQLGMLALNFTSGIISFLDPLISVTIDTITGKYINYKDLAYATEKLATNFVGNGLSLGSAKAYSKAAAGMQKFALSKSVVESFKDLDQGRITRFLSDGLTMKHFTLGDYTINSINMIATMHNYKYYKKADGTAGFYPKHQYISIVMKDQKCDVRKARSIYNKAVCMWDSCERNNLGDLVASNNEYGDAITDKTWNDVRSQVRSRSSIYNGIVPDLERSLMQTNIIWSFVTMLRNFFITGVWERFQSYRDFQVASLDEYGNPVDRPSTQEEIRIAKREQRYYKGGFSFATRTIEDGVDRAAFQWISNISPYLKYAMHILTHPADRSKYSEGHQTYLKENDLAQTDIYGIQKIFMELIVFSMLLLSSGFTQRWADDNQDNYWIQMLNLLTLRLTVERFTWFSPKTAMELISSPTAALSDWKRKMKLLDLTYDAIGLSDYKLHDEVKRGRYAGAERWKYNLFNGLSSFGLNNWYADTPEELGGGGARSVREKSNFYRGLVRDLPFGRTVIPRRDNTESSKKNKKMSH